ncbi:MAG: hypothetical protein JWM04_1846 [Verrucomicrobiales bacterium]|nr:hypothetical protein [Verrucomicrobiales bacterium]
MAEKEETTAGNSTALEKPKRFAWQPFTPRGVAAFSTGTFDRVLFLLILLGILISGVFVWFVKTRYCPVVVEFLNGLPESGAVTNGTMSGFGEPVVSDHRFLSLLANPDLGEVINRTADIQIEFYKQDGQAGGLAGFISQDYPTNWNFAFSRTTAAPWWGAWEPVILGVFAVIVFIFFYLLWVILPLLYFLPVRIFGYLADRSLTVGGAWRMAAISAAPASFCIMGAIVAYAWQWVDLIKFGLICVGYFAFFLIYPLLAIRHLEKLPEVQKIKANPFKS